MTSYAKGFNVNKHVLFFLKTEVSIQKFLEDKFLKENLPSAENLGGERACLLTSAVTSSLAACMASTPATFLSTMSLGLVACNMAWHTPAMSQSAVRLAAQRKAVINDYFDDHCSDYNSFIIIAITPVTCFSVDEQMTPSQPLCLFRW